ncbi:MAG: hypothetical protein R3B72_02000 [Polyangiaceae bacterium]
MHIGRMLAVCLAVLTLSGGAPVLAQQPAETPQPEATGTPAETSAATGEAAPGDTAEGGETGGEGTAPPAEAPPTGTVATGEAPPTETPGMDGGTYTVRLRDLQQRIDQLKEQIRRSHTRLSLLSDTILSGGSSGSRAAIRFENKLSAQFKLTRALIVLDGAVQYNKTDRSGALDDQKVIPIFNGSIPPGDHTVQVLVNLQGHGYGVFSYLRGYKFEVRSSHSFTAVEGKTTQLRVLAYEKGGVTTPLEERPAIRYLEKVATGLVDSGGQPAQ